jgi:hypothetical protein
VQAAYGGVLDEPVPERLTALVAERGAAPVDELATIRAARGARAKFGGSRFPQWAALAASLAIGLFVGILLTRGPAAPYEETGAGLVARGELEAALTRQLASAGTIDDVGIGISFRDRRGAFCRTFHMQREAPLAGLACRSGDDWNIQALAAMPAQEGELRPASAMPMIVLHGVDAAIAGEPLDAAAETAARDAGWRIAPNVAE